jgi:hypothetical protein
MVVKFVCPTYLLNVLALKLGDQGVEALLIGLNANGLENGLDIGGRGGGVASEAEKKVSCEVLHFECGF